MCMCVYIYIYGERERGRTENYTQDRRVGGWKYIPCSPYLDPGIIVQHLQKEEKSQKLNKSVS